jgi:hypothetical protein
VSVRDIPPSEWPTALEEFSREHRAWLATVERIDPNGSRHVEALQRPLDGVTAELAARRVVAIAIELQPDARGGTVIQVETPMHVRMDQAEAGPARGLEIEDQQGERMRIRFRAVPVPDALDGIAPGEIDA